MMPTWNAQQYLKFAGERTQPAIDLVNRINIQHPKKLVDIGCGPGNSTDGQMLQSMPLISLLKCCR